MHLMEALPIMVLSAINKLECEVELNELPPILRLRKATDEVASWRANPANGCVVQHNSSTERNIEQHVGVYRESNMVYA